MPVPARELTWLLALALGLTRPPVAAPSETPVPQPPRFMREQVEAALDGSERFLVIYGTRDPVGASLLRARALSFARRFSDGDTSLVMADRDAGVAAIARHHVVLLGGPRENGWTARLTPALPVTFSPGAPEGSNSVRGTGGSIARGWTGWSSGTSSRARHWAIQSAGAR